MIMRALINYLYKIDIILESYTNMSTTIFIGTYVIVQIVNLQCYVLFIVKYIYIKSMYKD